VKWPRYHKALRRLVIASLATAAAAVIGLQGWYAWYAHHYPLDMSRFEDRGKIVLDRDGELLHMFAAKDGSFRVIAEPSNIDPKFLRTLIAYEDQRFYSHNGVDYLSLIRAVFQGIRHREIISGGSTLTMQVARLLEPRPRTWQSKMIEMARASQLEANYSKDEILSLYLTLAPYGGAYEGIRTASWHLFGREPADLTWGEAALLAVLPQSPSRYRPDRFPERAARARDKVLRRVQPILGISDGDLTANSGADIRLAKRTDTDIVKQSALHLAFKLAGVAAPNDTLRSSLDRQKQAAAASVIKAASERLDSGMSAAAIIVDSWTGETLSYIGSPNYFDTERAGPVDMASAIRSPGSTLKPFIYGIGMDDGILHPLTLINDIKTRFGDYAPVNFRDTFHGEVTLQYALQKSLNIPAVKVLDKIGPGRFVGELHHRGIDLQLPGDEPAGLPIALGGAGISLEDLMRLYSAVASDGYVRDSQYFLAGNDDQETDGLPLISDKTRQYLVKMLQGVSPPDDLLPATARKGGRKIAFKTGTSWGFRDAWAIGFDERWVVGVWVGRASGQPANGHFGARTAAPILFDLFDSLPRSIGRRARMESAQLVWQRDLLPKTQRHFDKPTLLKMAKLGSPPEIRFPIDGSLVKISGKVPKVFIETAGGTGDLTLLINDVPIQIIPRRGSSWWEPNGKGFHKLSVVDEAGLTSSVNIRID